jgi:drug/metabolite transporter (DMT)-like permease
MYLRGIGDLILTVLIARIVNVDLYSIDKEFRSIILFRMITAFFSATFTFYAYYINHLAIATTLIFTSPIFTAIFAKYFLGENVNRWDLANMVSSVFGIMLLYDPFHFTTVNLVTLTGVIFGLLAAVTIAASNTVVRKVNADFNYLVSIFYYNIATTLGASFFSFW